MKFRHKMKESMSFQEFLTPSDHPKMAKYELLSKLWQGWSQGIKAYAENYRKFCISKLTYVIKDCSVTAYKIFEKSVLADKDGHVVKEGSKSGAGECYELVKFDPPSGYTVESYWAALKGGRIKNADEKVFIDARTATNQHFLYTLTNTKTCFEDEKSRFITNETFHQNKKLFQHFNFYDNSRPVDTDADPEKNDNLRLMRLKKPIRNTIYYRPQAYAPTTWIKQNAALYDAMTVMKIPEDLKHAFFVIGLPGYDNDCWENLGGWDQQLYRCFRYNIEAIATFTFAGREIEIHM